MKIEMKKAKSRILIPFAVAAIAVAIGTHWYAAKHMGEFDLDPESVERGSAALSGLERLPEEARAAMAMYLVKAARDREVERIRTARQTALDSYRAAVGKEHEAFRRRVDERTAVFDVVRAGIPQVVDKYGYSKCWDIAVALAKDEFNRHFDTGSTDNCDRMMNDDLRDGFYQPLLDARAEVIALLPEFLARLEACRQQCSAELNAIPRWDESLGEIPKSLQLESLQIEEVMKSLRMTQIGSAVEAVFDAACLPAVIRVVTSLMAKAGGRLAASAIAGGGTAFLDGPEPGPADLIGLGVFGVGVGMTAWEVRKAAKVIPAELNRVLSETVDQQCREVLTRVLDEGDKLQMTYSHAFVGGSDLSSAPTVARAASGNRKE